QGDQARRAFEEALAIAQRLADAEPDRADYQRDLSVSHERMGDLYVALGQGDQARRAFEQALAIAQRLADAEPDRADYQRDLALSFERMASVFEGEEAVSWSDRAVALRRRALSLQPEAAVLGRELAISLFQHARLTNNAQSLFESAALLRELRARGSLEAQYFDLADQLEEWLSSPSPGDDGESS
ncbi:MAG: tetratricopeptide repeat protein, partial [Planctomycetes bacterium]|nr:tetratricopeptide repeat protein [Planctomycetota bacterium]